MTQVLEIFFLNDLDEYLEVEVSPRGRHLVIMLDGYRNELVRTLPLLPRKVDVDNPCLSRPDATSCDTRWKAVVSIPKEYLPRDTNRFNAYAIHGDDFGQAHGDHLHYESLFPVDPAVTPEQDAPDFHYLEAFQPLDLTEIGYEPPTSLSDVWTSAKAPEQNLVNK